MKHRSQHLLSSDDRKFLRQFETCAIPPGEFHHREHIRLAYIYLSQNRVRDAYMKLRSALKAFIRRYGIDETKYHETITYAWILAVEHFMNHSGPTASSDEFIDLNPKLLESKIMLTHYTQELLFSETARARFVEPDLEPIPRHV